MKDGLGEHPTYEAVATLLVVRVAAKRRIHDVLMQISSKRANDMVRCPIHTCLPWPVEERLDGGLYMSSNAGTLVSLFRVKGLYWLAIVLRFATHFCKRLSGDGADVTPAIEVSVWRLRREGGGG